MFGMGLPELIVVVFVVILIVFPCWKIFGKAGFSPWLGVLMLVPVVNVAMIFFLAFAEWPCLRDRKTSDS